MITGSYRVTQQALTSHATMNLQQTLARLGDLQQQISSGKRLQRPSDDPVGAVSSLRTRGDIGRNDQIGRNISDAQGWLSTADDTLGSISTQLQRARDLTLQAQNGSLGAPEREAIATEIDNIRKTVLGLANAKYGNRYLFAGTANGPAYDASGAYTGTSGAVERTVAPGVKVQINSNGDAVFGTGGADLFANIASLAAAVRGGSSTAIDTALTTFDGARQVVSNSLADIGAREQRIAAMKDRNDNDSISLQQTLSDVEGVDLAKATMDMQMQQVAYQAALQVTAKVIQPTLVDFLR